MKLFSDIAFHKMLYRVVVGSQKRRQAAALALKDPSFNRTIDQSYPAAAIFSVIRDNKILRYDISCRFPPRQLA